MKAEARRKSLIEKYGSLEAYEAQRKEKIRKTKLANCKTEEERKALQEKFEWKDYVAFLTDESVIGKEVECHGCHKKFISKGNTTYCPSCMLKQHRIRKYGSYEKFKEEANQHLKDSLLEKYGVDNIMKDKAHQEKAWKTRHERCSEEEIQQKAKNTRIKKYGNPYYNNREKAAKTNLKRYGNKVGKDILTNIKEKYGVENTMDLESAKENMVKTRKEKYGEHLEEIVKKSRKTKLERYGNPGYVNSEKIRETFLKRYGGFYSRYTYDYDGLVFDSSWELYYYLYLKDHNIKFIYKPSPIKYKDGDKERQYFPDFYTDHFVEIKGEHLYKEGYIINRYGERDLAKTKVLKDNKVEVLTGKELKSIFKEIDNKYGSHFVKSFQREGFNG